VDAVEELAHGDDADRPVLVVDERLDRPGTALALDEQVRVDQDGQGFSGTPASRRIRRRSSANPSSTWGSDLSKVRSLLAGSTRTRGGASTATGAPFRTISISSPAATRLRTSEKLRAASVALRRTTSRAYQINPTD
jgi:hypothetical protein